MLYRCCYFLRYAFFFFKQKTAYELRISDWSSDVCSSDLHARRRRKKGRPAGSVTNSREPWTRTLALRVALVGNTAQDAAHAFSGKTARGQKAELPGIIFGIDGQGREFFFPDGLRAFLLGPRQSIGRASGWESVGPCVYISGGAVQLQKNRR